MEIGDHVKVFSSISDYDGQTGRVVMIASDPGAPAPFVVEFGDAILEPFSERELVSLSPIEPLWLSAPLETLHAPYGCSVDVQRYIGRVIAQRFIGGERRRITRHGQKNLRKILATLADRGYGPCIQCGQLMCVHKTDGITR